MTSAKRLSRPLQTIANPCESLQTTANRPAPSHFALVVPPRFRYHLPASASFKSAIQNPTSNQPCHSSKPTESK